jgi:serine/threonine protein kinase
MEYENKFEGKENRKHIIQGIKRRERDYKIVNTGNIWEQKPEARRPMPAGTQICIEGTDLVIARDGKIEDYYAGSTCMVYSGHVVSGAGIVPGIRVIIKEFYPSSKNVLFDIERREDGALHIEQSTQERKEYIEKWKQFELGYKYQQELSGSNAMEIAIKPLFAGKWGDSFYIISDAHMGTDLKERKPTTLKEKLAAAVSLAETMDILHENNYMMLDIKPENFLWINKPNIIRIVDTDSIVAYDDPDRIRRQILFSNQEFMSPDVEFIRYTMQHGASPKEEAEVRSRCLTPNADRYTMGAFLYQLFFGKNPQFKDYSEYVEKTLQGGEQNLLMQLKELYPTEKRGEREKTELALKSLLAILKKLLIRKPWKRQRDGFRTDKEIVSALNEIYAGLASEKLVLRKEIATANARFAAYNLLQKYPLFDYQMENPEGKSELHVAIIGKHVMRKDMLSAVISIGQMLEQTLTVELVADDAEQFWDDYLSASQNPALAKAVTWEVNGQSRSEEIDKGLVSRSLAHLKIYTDTGYIPQAGYYILLEEDETKLRKWLGDIEDLVKIEEPDAKRKVFVGILQNEFINEREFSKHSSVSDTVTGSRTDSRIDTYIISSDAFTESYSEQMFSEKIYQMGLMCHTYYANGMEQGAMVDMEEMDRQFRKDVYNITSSERCALHGIYKMASIGIDRKQPGRSLGYFRMIRQPQVLEELAWLEHMSWTAYMLTSGACPVAMEEFGTYAYLRGNDWKDKSDPDHIRHPLLAASERNCANDLRGVKSLRDVPEEVAHSLDPLDKVSWEIARWYVSRKEEFKSSYRDWLSDIRAFSESGGQSEKSEELKELVDRLETDGLDCIENIGNTIQEQDTEYRDAWKNLIKELKLLLLDDDEGNELIVRAERIMKPVLQSYDDRDFKQYDRDLTYAVIDMIV